MTDAPKNNRPPAIDLNKLGPMPEALKRGRALMAGHIPEDAPETMKLLAQRIELLRERLSKVEQTNEVSIGLLEGAMDICDETVACLDAADQAIQQGDPLLAIKILRSTATGLKRAGDGLRDIIE
ncbi:MAG: hypothetical protein AB1592_13390 [Pseudomonadota bacterium]